MPRLPLPKFVGLPFKSPVIIFWEGKQGGVSEVVGGKDGISIPSLLNRISITSESSVELIHVITGR